MQRNNQASAVGKFIKASKKRLAYTNNGYNNDVLVLNLRPILVDNCPNMTSARKHKILAALQRITFVVKETLTPTIIQGGYEKTGQYPLNLDRAMSKCLRPISVNDMNVHENRVTSLMERFHNIFI